MSNKISAFVGLGTLRRYGGLSGRSGDTMVCAFRWQRTCWFARDALRYLAVVERGRSRSLAAALVRCWSVVGGQNALMGYCVVRRSAGTMFCGLVVAIPRVQVSPLRVYCDVSVVMSRQCSAVCVRNFSWFGLNRLGCVRVQTRVCDTVSRAHKTIACHRRFIQPSSHSVQHHTNAGKNHGVVYLHGRCCTLSEEHRLLW